MTLAIRVSVERWPIAGTFTISRGSRTEAVVVVAEVSDGRAYAGAASACPTRATARRWRASSPQIEAARARRVDREALRRRMPPGAARNALDCALWDLEAKAAGMPAWQLAGLAPPRPVTTAYTLSLGSPEAMAEAAARAAAAGRCSS